MRAAELRRGACLDLPLEVIDKYFMADGTFERFALLTAKAICGQCAVRALCLVDAITLPTPSAGVRGGETADSIAALRYRYIRGETAEALALDALRKQPNRPGAGRSKALRAGRFLDATLFEGPLTTNQERRYS